MTRKEAGTTKTEPVITLVAMEMATMMTAKAMTTMVIEGHTMTAREAMKVTRMATVILTSNSLNL